MAIVGMLGGEHAVKRRAASLQSSRSDRRRESAACPRTRTTALPTPPSASPRPSPTAPTAPPRARCSRRSASPTTTSRSRSSASPPRGSRRCRATSTSATLAAARQGGHPRRRRHADGVQHDLRLRRRHDGHRGHAGSLISREVIADSIELVAPRPHVRRAGLPRRLRQDDPGRGDGARAPRHPGLVLYSGSIAPGRYEGKDVTIQDVFEAVGALRARARSTPRSCTRSRTRPAPAPAPAAASSPPTRWRWRSSSSASRPAG